MTAPLNPTVGADSGIWGGELNNINNAHEARQKARYQGVYDSRRTGTLDETTTPQYPDSSMGPWGGLGAYDFVNNNAVGNMRLVVTDPRPICYKSFRQINKTGSTGIVSPEQDTNSWGNVDTVLSSQSADAAIAAGVLDERIYLHSASPISSANRITNSGGKYCANLRDWAYCRYVATSMANMARNYGFDTYFVDNMNDSVSSMTAGGAGPAVEYADDNEGEFVLLEAYRHIFMKLAQHGIKCILNGGGTLNKDTTPTPQIHANENFNRGDSQVRFYDQLLRYPSILGFSWEFYMQAANTAAPADDSIFTTSSASGGGANGVAASGGPSSWGSYWFRAQQYSHSLGKGHWGTVYGPSAPGPTGSARNLRFSHGIDLLLWDGVSPGGMLVFANTSGANTDTSPTYKWDVGYPRGPYRRLTPTSSGFYRDFVREDGTAVQLKVNMDFTNAVTINGTSVAAGDAVAVG